MKHRLCTLLSAALRLTGFDALDVRVANTASAQLPQTRLGVAGEFTTRRLGLHWRVDYLRQPGGLRAEVLNTASRDSADWNAPPSAVHWRFSLYSPVGKNSRLSLNARRTGAHRAGDDRDYGLELSLNSRF